MEPQTLHPLTQIKEVVVAVSAAVTAGAAVWALFRWRAETVWRENREAARSILRGCLKVRDGFQIVRNPLVLASEFPENYQRAPADSPEERVKADAFVYESRLRILNEGMRDLEAAVLEAEALWGSEVEDRMKKVRRCRSELVNALQDHMHDIGTGHLALRDRPERQQKVRDAVYGGLETDENELTVKTREALDGLLDLAEPHLGR